MGKSIKIRMEFQKYRSKIDVFEVEMKVHKNNLHHKRYRNQYE